MLVAVMAHALVANEAPQPLRPVLIGEWPFSGARGAMPCLLDVRKDSLQELAWFSEAPWFS